MKSSVWSRATLLLALPLCLLAQDEHRSRWYEAYRPTDTFQVLDGEWKTTTLNGDRRDLWKMPGAFDALDRVPEIRGGRGRGNQQPKSPEISLKWYQRDFTLSPPLRQSVAEGNRIFLHFGGVAWQWSAWLNGQPIVQGNLDVLNSYEYDVTALLRPDANNTLTVAATDNHGMAKDLKHAFVFGEGRTNRHGGFIAPTPETSSDPLLWGEVELWSRPATRMEDIFIQPDFRNKRLVVDLEVAGTAKTSIEVEILDAEQRRLEVAFPTARIAAPEAGRRQVRLQAYWPSPRLWNILDPYLHFARLNLRDADSGRLLESRLVRFGFREIWIDNGDVMLNGKRLFVARFSFVMGNEHALRSQEVREHQLGMKDQLNGYVSQWKQANSLNAIRIHRSAFVRPAALATYTDELGVFLIPESGFCQGDRFDVTQPAFWENTGRYLEKWAKSARNNPSILCWNLTNEFLWTGTEKKNPHCPELMYDLEKRVKSVDPTRLISWDGDWDLAKRADDRVGPSEIINLHYPNESSGRWWPTDCWAFENAGPENPVPIRGFYGQFKWPKNSKPIFVGEYSWSQVNYFEGPANLSKHFGDRIYDFSFWKTGIPQGIVNRWEADAFRVMRFALINPWLHTAKGYMDVTPRETVILRNEPTVHPEGTQVRLPSFLLNDQPVDRAYELAYYLQSAAGKIAVTTEKFLVPGGGMKAFTTTLALPVVGHPVNYRLVYELNFNGTRIHQREFDLRSRPDVRLQWPAGVSLFDPVGKTAAWLTRLGLTPFTLRSVDQCKTLKAVVVGEGVVATLDPTALRTLHAFVQEGGNVLLMGESKWGHSGFATNAVFKLGQANRAWVRAAGHPVLRGLDDLDLAYWGRDHWVNDWVFSKPEENSDGAWRTLIDVGSRHGLRGAALSEIHNGKGRFILNQLHLGKAVEEPGGRALLNNLLTYLQEPAPARRPVCLQLDAKSALLEHLQKSDLVTATWDPEKRDAFLIVDANDRTIDKERLRSWVEKGGRAWVTGLTAKNVEAWSRIIPGLALSPIKDFTGALIRERAPVLWGISNEELFWFEGYWLEDWGDGLQFDRMASMKKMADIAHDQITAPDAKSLLSPGILTQLNAGQGAWTLSTINFEDGLVKSKQKAGRLLQALVTNFDIGTKTKGMMAREVLTPVSLRAFANRGFQDNTAGDGKGGWIDAGFAQDLHLFPQNISGIDNANLPMPAPPPSEWPSPMELSGVDFEIIDPRSNHDKTCIVLCADGTQTTKPNDYLKQALGIPVQAKFDHLYSLHTSALTGDNLLPRVLWKFVFHYDDGDTAESAMIYPQHTGHWHQPKELPHATVAWIGESLKLKPVGLYMAKIPNPHPAKTVTAIDVVASVKEGVTAIIGLTIGRKQLPKP